MRLKNFLLNSSGNMGMLFGFALVPLIGMVGIAVDYSRASNAKVKLTNAIDTAAISANRDASYTLAQKTDIARKIVIEQLADSSWIKYDPANIIVTDDNGLLDVSLNATVNTAFMGVLGIPTMLVSSTGQSINRIEETAEIALVLDTTGSMQNDMDELKDSVKDFVNTIMPTAAGKVKMGVVPYVAAVNPGPAAMNDGGLMDVAANATHHAQFFEDGGYVTGPWDSVALRNSCEGPPSGGGGNGGGGGPPPFDPGTGGSDGSAAAYDWLQQLAYGASNWFTIGSAEAAGAVTPDTTGPFTSTSAHFTVSIGKPRIWQDITVKIPNGFRPNPWDPTNPCSIWNPAKISHFDLFDRIPGATWKGCVEARREPFDVTDQPLDRSNPDTSFVPYFWPDEPDSAEVVDGVTQAIPNNNYMKDSPVVDPLGPIGLMPVRWIDRQDKVQSILKYNGSSNGGSVQLVETGSSTLGPNKGCPDPILPLTANADEILNKTNSLTHQLAGGTINSEGIMWGWRLLSPEAPFTDGKPFGQVKKYIVLMSDGKNEITGNAIKKGVLYSDYTAYGYLGKYETRLSRGTAGIGSGPEVRTFPEVNTYLNDRFAQACSNAKTAGVTIFTILFRETDTATRKLMQDCASKPSYALLASDTAALKQAFSGIASVLQNLRLTK
jgi:Flp pilus assembly protein TadG